MTETNCPSAAAGGGPVNAGPPATGRFPVTVGPPATDRFAVTGARLAEGLDGPEPDLVVRSGWSRGSLAWSRLAAGWILAIAGLTAYNWWVLVPLKPGLMTSPDELFSNLEVSGQPYAAAMQHADTAAGVLMVAAFLVLGRRSVLAGGREWLAMVGFAVAGSIGGLFPEVCADGINAVCRRMEWKFQLPSSQYVHIVAGIGEFAAITVALLLAYRRTRRQPGRMAGVYRNLLWAALVAYPLLGLAYLTNRLGGIMEGVFFVGFTVMVLAQVLERSRATGRGLARPDQAR